MNPKTVAIRSSTKNTRRITLAVYLLTSWHACFRSALLLNLLKLILGIGLEGIFSSSPVNYGFVTDEVLVVSGFGDGWRFFQILIIPQRI